MKVLFFGTKHFAELRGAAIANYRNVRALRDRGHDITFVQTARPEDRVFIAGVRHVYWDVPRKSLYPLLFALRPVRGFDVIHAVDEAGAYLALRHQLRSLPLVVQFHPPRIPEFTFRSARWRWRYIELAARLAPSFLTPSRFIAAAIIDRFGIDPQRVHTIPHAIDSVWFDAFTEHREAEKPIRIVLINMKGVGVALRALAKVAARTDFRLELYGIDKQETEHRALARELGLAERVRFEGFVPNEKLPGRIAEADLLLHPTDTESFGQVLAEASALGLPIVSSRASAVPELVEPGVTGLLCPVDDVDAYAAALRALLLDRELRRKLGRAARERALRLWRSDVVAARIETEVYAPLASRSRA